MEEPRCVRHLLVMLPSHGYDFITLVARHPFRCHVHWLPGLSSKQVDEATESNATALMIGIEQRDAEISDPQRRRSVTQLGEAR